MWLGATGNGSDMVFGVPEGTEVKVSDRQKAERLGYKGDFTRLGNSCWFTSMEHGRRHESLTLNSLARNKKVIRSKKDNTYSYQKYDNYDAIEIPNTKLIPSDYDGVMGVPISFLDKYCPEQFEIITLTKTPIGNDFRTKIYGKQIQHNPNGTVQEVTKANDGAVLKIEEPLTDKPYYEVDGLLYKATYPRLLIKHKNLQK